MKHTHIMWLAAIGLSLVSGIARAQVPVALFREGAVLQRGQAIPVWGYARPGSDIEVTLGENQAKTTTGPDGRWSVTLPEMTAGGPYVLTIDGDRTVVIRNVAIGDVWFCSGQSNMRWTLARSDPAEVEKADYPMIRFFIVEDRVAIQPHTAIGGSWQVVKPGQAGPCTALGYWFARVVQQRTHVPIGIISSAWDGTPIESWLKPEAATELAEVSAVLETRKNDQIAYRKNMAEYLDKMEDWLPVARESLAADQPLPDMPVAPTAPSAAAGNPHWYFALYYGMVQPITPYPIAGVLWYQGETNGKEGESYFRKLRALAAGYREDWQRPDLPVYIVQLPNIGPPNASPAGGDGWSMIREAQRKFLTLPHTGMATSIDIGKGSDAHPPNKPEVARRLALWAFRDVYGYENQVVSGPIMRRVTVEAGEVCVFFDHTGSGLMVGKRAEDGTVKDDSSGTLGHFALAGEDKVWHWADARIVDSVVFVTSDKVPNPVAVRYGYANNPQSANLYNREGLPASPFRSDDW